MAEVRRGRPGRGGAVAAAIEQAMGSGVRPVTPGGSPEPARPAEGSSAAATPISATTYLMNEEFVVPTDEPAGPDTPEKGDGLADIGVDDQQG